MASPWLTHPPLGPLFSVVLLLLLAERIGELLLDRRNARWLKAHGARWHGPDGFGLILAAQVLLFVLLAAEVAFAPWARTGWWTWPALALALLAQALRYWCIATLGPRWNIRVVTLPGAPRIAHGPYRFLPHPNYVAVFTEVVVLPLAFGAWLTLLVLVPLKLVALRRRIRFEEKALGDAQPAPGRPDERSNA
jgi:methyltransferase